MDKKYETIVFTSDEFGDDLWNVVGQQLKILGQAEYIAVVYEEEHGIVVIQYNYYDPAMGTAQPEWLDPEESDKLFSIMNEDK